MPQTSENQKSERPLAPSDIDPKDTHSQDGDVHIPENLGPNQVPTFVSNDRAYRTANLAASRWKPKDLKLKKQTQDYLVRLATDIRFFSRIDSVLAVKMGQGLIKAREILPVRGFKEWLQISCGMSRRSAYHYMQIASKIPDPQAVVQFTYGTLLKITNKQVSDELRNQALATNSDAEAMQVIKQGLRLISAPENPEKKPASSTTRLKAFQRATSQFIKFRELITTEDKSLQHEVDELLKRLDVLGKKIEISKAE